jgi:hypothetical protein
MSACPRKQGEGQLGESGSEIYYDRGFPPRIPAIIRSTDAIERKLAGVISKAGIMMSNSASILNINSTMSSEVKPSCANSSSPEIGSGTERFARISATNRNKRSSTEPVLRSGMSFFPAWSIPFDGVPDPHSHRRRNAFLMPAALSVKRN